MTPTVRLLAVTLHQPWASALFLRSPTNDRPLKRFETRSWPSLYRGQIAIHAGKSDEGREAFDLLASDLRLVGVERWEDLPRGVVLGTAILEGYYRTDDLLGSAPGYAGLARKIDDQERRWGNFSPGRWAWLLSSAVAFREPVPARGYTKLWRWEPPPGWSQRRTGVHVERRAGVTDPGITLAAADSSLAGGLP